MEDLGRRLGNTAIGKTPIRNWVKAIKINRFNRRFAIDSFDWLRLKLLKLTVSISLKLLKLTVLMPFFCNF